MINSETPKLIYPEGFKPGCLPRSSHGNFPRAEERIEIVPRSEWEQWKDTNSLKPYVKTILNQGSVGSCAAEATTQALMIARAIAGLPHVVLNPWSIYCYTSHGRDAGSSIDENLQVAMEQGICPMDVWPRSKGWSSKPDAAAREVAKQYRIAEAFDIANGNEFISALLRGMPVVFGAQGHAVCGVRHLDERNPEVANSWSETWGDRGYGVWCSYAAVQWSYGAFAVRAA